MSEGQSRAERLVLQDQARLLNRLILEERRGWPELPEPPAGPPVPRLTRSSRSSVYAHCCIPYYWKRRCAPCRAYGLCTSRPNTVYRPTPRPSSGGASAAVIGGRTVRRTPVRRQPDGMGQAWTTGSSVIRRCSVPAETRPSSSSRASATRRRYLTDGVVDKSALGAVSALVGIPNRVAKTLPSQLCNAGLWRDCGDYWEINDYLEYNPSRTDVEKRPARETRGQGTCATLVG
jgi:hypothetical protein